MEPEADEAKGSQLRRVVALITLGLAGLAAALLLIVGGSSYTVTAQFDDASQLVNGNQVEVGGVPVGSVEGISLGPNGTALVKMSVDADYAPLHQGTTATVRSQSLSGVANRFI